jgi:hypothetical protein
MRKQREGVWSCDVVFIYPLLVMLQWVENFIYYHISCMFSFSVEQVLIDYLDSILLIIQALELMFSSL